MKAVNSAYRLAAVVLTSFMFIGTISTAHAYSVYRSVTADATGAVSWVAANFGVSGNPPTLSFFYFASDVDARQGLPNAQCFVKVDLVNTNNPQPNDHDNVGYANIPVGGNVVDQPRPFPWTITFDNNPAGHWSIARPDVTAVATNAAASRVSAAGFNSLATSDNAGVSVINGSLVNCVP